MAKGKLGYICNQCSYKSSKWLGKCPNCDQWGSLDEEVDMKNLIIDYSDLNKIKKLSDIKIQSEYRMKTKYTEFDRVLGGGLTRAEVVLITGAPGIGKSTFLLSLANEYSNSEKVLYISGEESLRQIKERADRIEVKSENLFLLSETRLEHILKTIEIEKPKIVVIDSIQTLYSEQISSLPSSVSQIRECSLKLIEIAKKMKSHFISLDILQKMAN